MLCTRCQQREAKPFGDSPEVRAKVQAMFEEKFGAPWPFPDDLCKECFGDWAKSPEGKARFEPFRRAIEAEWKARVEKWKTEFQEGVLKVLDVADAIAGKL